MKRPLDVVVQDGLYGGLLAGAVVAAWFFASDAVAGVPFRTPAVLAYLFFHRDTLEISVELVAFYTILHLGVFAALGIATAMVLGAFATMTLLTKNSFLDEIRKQYVITARMKGLAERRVLYGHVFRNAMLIIIAGFPGAFIGAFFSGALLIETIFSLDGLGLLGFESVLNRDYAVVFATLYVFSLVGLVVNLLSDLTYSWIDPRIDFETREA